MTKYEYKSKPIVLIRFHMQLVKHLPVMHQRTLFCPYKLEGNHLEISLGSHQFSSDNHISSTQLLTALFDESPPTQYDTMQRIFDRRNFDQLDEALSIDTSQMNVPSNVNKYDVNKHVPYFSNKRIHQP